MKVLKIITLLLCLHSAAYTQEKFEKYFQVNCDEKGFGGKIRVSISVGNVDSLFSFKDSTIITNLNKVKDLKTKMDVLNYMSLLHWTFVSTTQVLGNDTFFFKKVFDKSKLLVQ